MNIFCRFGRHKWQDISKPFVGRRNFNHMEGGVMVMEQGPEEAFYPSEDGPNYFRRECKCCHKQQTFLFGRWA